MVGPSGGKAKVSPVNRAQRDRHVDIEIDPLAHNIFSSCVGRLQVFNKSPADMLGLVHANEFDTRTVADDPSQ